MAREEVEFVGSWCSPGRIIPVVGVWEQLTTLPDECTCVTRLHQRAVAHQSLSSQRGNLPDELSIPVQVVLGQSDGVQT